MIVVAEELASDLRSGLSEEEGSARLARDGPNRLSRAPRPAYIRIAARQLFDPLVGLLVGAMVVSFLIGEALEAAAIGAIVFMNALLGFTQEARAERAVHALREAVGRAAAVIRAGREREIPVVELVRGDLVVLREGERVPADGRLSRTEGLDVDESILTGESLPVEKGSHPVAAAAALGDRSSMVFAGTWVTRGHGIALVTATGDSTEQGRIAGLVSEAKPPQTPLQRRLARLARTMVVAGAVVTAVIAVGLLLRDSSLHEAFLVGVSVAVAAVPEGLAATVTIALALGARAMAVRGAIARRLAAVETLGETTVICTDKTGTLTENRLHLAAAVPEPGVTVAQLLGAAVLASAATVGREEELRAVGDPLEAALLLAARGHGLSRRSLLDGRRLVREFPFDPVRRRMTVVYEEEGGFQVVTKGAPEVLIQRAAVGRDERERLAELARDLAEQGSRVIAVAERRLPTLGELDDEEIDRDLAPLGLVALHDPLRPEAAPAVEEARLAGIAVRMVTGDHRSTALAVARELALDDDAVHARVSPDEKLRLVVALQEQDEVVAVTGDGVNDSPALRRADVGVTMGRAGTEAAREAADLVLTDDNFATIVAAVQEGRRISDNVRKFVAFLLSANLGEVVLFAVAVLGGLGIPMTVVQVLTVNVLTDGLPAVALAKDPVSPETMRRPPRPREALFAPHVSTALGIVGALVGAVALAAFIVGRELGGGVAQTMAFATVAVTELVLVFSLRSRMPAWREPWNPYLAGGVAISAAIAAACIWVPVLQDPFGTVALAAPEVAIVIGLAAVPAIAAEILKAIVRRREYDSRLGEEAAR